MWTLTIDPTLFRDPESAFLYLRSHRCVAELIRELHARGHLHSRDYFYVVEWHKNGWPHFHLLVNATYVPHGEVCEIWNRNRPESAGPLVGNRPGFGAVKFSAPRFADAVHASRYATKYIIKHPKEGYPDWVLNFTGRIRRYGTSHGFWGEASKKDSANKHDDTCFCKKCRGDVEPRKPSTIRERLQDCCRGASLFRVISRPAGLGATIDISEFIAELSSWAEIRKEFGLHTEYVRPVEMTGYKAYAVLCRQRGERVAREVFYAPVSFDRPDRTTKGMKNHVEDFQIKGVQRKQDR